MARNHRNFDGTSARLQSIVRVSLDPASSSTARHRRWYAIKDADGRWLFGPSKFVGYRDADAAGYLSGYSRNEAVGEAELGAENSGSLRSFWTRLSVAKCALPSWSSFIGRSMARHAA